MINDIPGKIEFIRIYKCYSFLLLFQWIRYLLIQFLLFTSVTRMSRCQHGQIIALYCLKDDCTSKQVGGCQLCMKKYHCHLQSSQTITVEKLEQYCKKAMIRPDPKVKSRILQDAIYNYFVILKSEINSSIDTVSRAIMNKLNYPFLNFTGHLEVFNKIKIKEYKKVNRKELKSFCEFIDQVSKQEFEKNEKQIYCSIVNELSDKLSLINSSFNLYGQAIKQYDPKFVLDHVYHEKINQIITTITATLQQGLEIKQRSNGSKGSHEKKFDDFNNTLQLPRDREKVRKVSFDITSDVNHIFNYGNQLIERKKKLIQIGTDPRQNRKLSPMPERNYLKVQREDGIIENKKSPSSSGIDRSRQSIGKDYDTKAIAHTTLPVQQSKSKFYEHRGQVKQKKYTIPVPVANQQERLQCSSPILKKKKTMKQEKGFTLLPVNQKQKNGETKVISEKQDHSNEKQQILMSEKQADSLALVVKSLSLSAEDAIPYLQASIKHASNNLSAAEYLSYLYLQVGKSKQCLALCNKFIEQIESSSDSKKIGAHLYNNKAAALNLMGRYSESIQLLQKCLQSFEIDVNYKNLGDAYFSIGIYQKAILNYEKAIRMNSKLDQAYFNLAVCLYIQGHFSEAKIQIRKALNLCNDNESYIELESQIIKKIGVQQVKSY